MPEQLPEVLTVDEMLADPAWRIGRSKTYEALKDGTIPAVRIGGRYFIPRAKLIALMSGEPVVRETTRR